MFIVETITGGVTMFLPSELTAIKNFDKGHEKTIPLYVNFEKKLTSNQNKTK